MFRTCSSLVGGLRGAGPVCRAGGVLPFPGHCRRLSHRFITGVCVALAAIAGWLPGMLDNPLAAQTTGKASTAAKGRSEQAGIGKSKSAAKSRSEETAETSGPADYSSKNFLIHTDLSPAEARDLLKKLETMLGLIADYWGRPPSGIIECYVVKDLAKWNGVPLDPNGRQSIEGQAGVTISRTITRGNQFIAKAVVYAIADRGTPQHESVHAYCAQAFGRVGPVWYSEGMAEVGQYFRQGDKSVNAHEIVIEYLRTSEPKSLEEIVNGNERSGDSWENYAWRWALCHLLGNNPNYAARFRPLGMGLLTNADVSFESTYGPMAKEISFEYLQFLKHVETGYRVDLCSWDWKAKFKPNRTGLQAVSKIEAGRGWQPSRLTVVKGDEYEYCGTGSWSIDKAATALNADGASDGSGRLVGVLMADYELGEPFELGAYGSFVASGDGDLYLRCQDRWNELADNKGRVSVQLKLKGVGKPLTPPATQGSEKPGDSAVRKSGA